jgi:hypothetical protein
MLALKESFLRTRRTRDLSTNHEDLFPSWRPYPLICGSKDSDYGKSQGSGHMRDARIVSNEEPTSAITEASCKRKSFTEWATSLDSVPSLRLLSLALRLDKNDNINCKCFRIPVNREGPQTQTFRSLPDGGQSRSLLKSKPFPSKILSKNLV